MKINLERIHKRISYPTILRLFEIENQQLNDMCIGGVKYIVKNKLNLVPLDSNNNTFRWFSTDDYATVIKFSVKIEYTKDIEDVVEEGDWIKIALLKCVINICSTKVMYIHLDKNKMWSIL